MNKCLEYLMLDKDDITKVCGVISNKEILKEITKSQLSSMLVAGTLFRGKYILVENEHAKQQETFKDVKILETERKYFYVSRDAEVFSIEKKTGKRYTLSNYMHNGFLCVKIQNKEYRLKNLVAQTFLKAKKGDNVKVKNNDQYNCSADNLIVTPLDVFLKQNRVNRARDIGLFEDGKLVKKWSCASECAKDLHYSKRAIHFMLNKVSTVYDLRAL